jgi:2-oxoglutarate ferredoxin oxidoreductase subunit beta
VESNKWLEENMTKEYPLGVFVDKVGDGKWVCIIQ